MKNRSNWIIGLFALAFAAILALALRAYFSEYATFNSENLDRFIRGFGSLAIGGYALAYFLGSPIPFLAPILMATGGLLFGPLEGTVVAILSATATSLLPFMVARRLGRTWVQQRLKGSRLEDLLARANRGSGFTFILLLRLVPVLPWEIQNYVAGVTHVRLLTYLAATLLGSTPLSVSLVFVGATAKHPGSWQFFAALAVTAAVLVTPVLIVWARTRNRKPKDGENQLENGSAES